MESRAQILLDKLVSKTFAFPHHQSLIAPFEELFIKRDSKWSLNLEFLVENDMIKLYKTYDKGSIDGSEFRTYRIKLVIDGKGKYFFNLITDEEKKRGYYYISYDADNYSSVTPMDSPYSVNGIRFVLPDDEPSKYVYSDGRLLFCQTEIGSLTKSAR